MFYSKTHTNVDGSEFISLFDEVKVSLWSLRDDIGIDLIRLIFTFPFKIFILAFAIVSLDLKEKLPQAFMQIEWMENYFRNWFIIYKFFF